MLRILLANVSYRLEVGRQLIEDELVVDPFVTTLAGPVLIIAQVGDGVRHGVGLDGAEIGLIVVERDDHVEVGDTVEAGIEAAGAKGQRRGDDKSHGPDHARQPAQLWSHSSQSPFSMERLPVLPLLTSDACRPAGSRHIIDAVRAVAGALRLRGYQKATVSPAEMLPWCTPELSTR